MSSPETRLAASASPGQLVVGAGLVLIAAQLVFRGWASWHGWFYGDDFEFLSSFTGRGLHLHDLLAPHDSQFMPGGLFFAWIVAHGGAFDWRLASLIVVGFQLLADLACLWMLVTLFGRRWACLGLLSLYLFSTLTLTAFMWWAAAMNQVPVQAAFFAAIAFHVRYLRGRRPMDALATALTIVLGLLFYVKAALILIPILVITLIWFREAPPHPWRRTLRAHGAVALGYAAVGIAYAVYYLIHVPNPIAGSRRHVPYGALADSMLHQALGPEILGGPWRWVNSNPPVAVIDTPRWAVDLTWLLIAVAVTIVLQRRRGDWRAILVIAPYLAATFMLTALGRAVVYGGVVGRELRYLADAAPVLVLGIGLFLLPLASTGGAPAERAGAPALAPPRRRRSAAVGAVAVTALAVGAAVSNMSYVRHWTAAFPAKSFTQNVIAASKDKPLNILDATVPNRVLNGTEFPANLPSHLFRPLGDRVVAVSTGTDPLLLDQDGRPHVPRIVDGSSSSPGPIGGCGYAITNRPTAMPMNGDAPFFWWMRIGYLAGADGEIAVTLGGKTHRLPIQAGLHAIFLNGSGATRDLSITTTDPSASLCVDQVAIGNPGAAS